MRPAIVLRGHHILCIQHYKGLGYSPEFVDNMSALVARLKSEPDITVQLVTKPDDICRACPNLNEGSCYDSSKDAEQDRMEQDQLVLDALGLQPGDRSSWAEIMAKLRLGRGFLSADACGLCCWLRDGYCGSSKAIDE